MPKFDFPLQQELPRVTLRQRATYERNLLPFDKELIKDFRTLSQSSLLPQSDKDLANYMLRLNCPSVEYFLHVYEHWRTCKYQFPSSAKSLSKELMGDNASPVSYMWPVPDFTERSVLKALDDLLIVYDSLTTTTKILKDRLETMRKTIQEFKLEAPHLLEEHRYDYLIIFIELVLLESSLGLGSGYLELLRIQMDFCSRRTNLANSQFQLAANFELLCTSVSKNPLSCLTSEDQDDEDTPCNPQIVSAPKGWFAQICFVSICLLILGISAISALGIVSDLIYDGN